MAARLEMGWLELLFLRRLFFARYCFVVVFC